LSDFDAVTASINFFANQSLSIAPVNHLTDGLFLSESEVLFCDYEPIVLLAFAWERVGKIRLIRVPD
jgi:hypothetical protein